MLMEGREAMFFSLSLYHSCSFNVRAKQLISIIIFIRIMGDKRSVTAEM